MSTLRIECNKRGQLQKSEERGKVASTNLIRYQNKDCTLQIAKWREIVSSGKELIKYLYGFGEGTLFFDPLLIFPTPTQYMVLSLKPILMANHYTLPFKNGPLWRNLFFHKRCQTRISFWCGRASTIFEKCWRFYVLLVMSRSCTMRFGGLM